VADARPHAGASSNKGISPGGDHTMIVYEGFLGADGLPIHQVGDAAHALHFDPAYYQGRRPVFDPGIFHSTEATTTTASPIRPPAARSTIRAGPSSGPCRAST